MKFNDTLTTLIKQSLESARRPLSWANPASASPASSRTWPTPWHTGFHAAVQPAPDKADLTGARLAPYTKDDGTQSYKQSSTRTSDPGVHRLRREEPA
ncbi:hypothetical protein SAZ11_60905 [Streptomyces sp. FXJ1.4098]|nr:hypothetical protein [Streptomyces sp. FXJ1.4098]